METNRKLWVIRLLVLGALVVGLNAKPASAQALRGKFTVPSEVRWGPATLPAGAYSFTLDNRTIDSRVTVTRGTQFVAKILANGISYATPGRSEMILQDGTVRELRLPQIGLILYYAPPKGERVAAKRELAQLVFVTIAVR